MNKLLFCLAIVFAGNTVYAQKKVTIKGGTVVNIEAITNVKAVDVQEGQMIDFRTVNDVIADDIVAIPAGTIVKGVVYEAKRSSAFGTKGRLGVSIRRLYLPSGDLVNFTSSNIYIQGQNRTPISVIVFCLCFVPLPCGGKAELKAGTEYQIVVANNTNVTI